MKRRLVAAVTMVVIGVAFASCSGGSELADSKPAEVLADGFDGTVAIVDVDVFDGTAILRDTTVIVHQGLIAAIGPDVEVPDGAQVVDGAGMTLLPGLIDSHTHTDDAEDLQRAVEFGVTTHLDMFTDPRFLAEELVTDRAQPHRPQADLFSAGTLATVAGGHGTQLGVDIETIGGPGDAAAWVEGRMDEGASYIKLVLDDGARYGQNFPTLDQETIAVLTAEAHARDLLVLAHVATLQNAVTAIDGGSDGLAHVFTDRAATDEFVERMAESNTFIVPTIVVLSSGSDTPSGPSVIDDPALGPRLEPSEIIDLGRNNPTGVRIDVLLDSVGRFHEASVPVLAGTDAPIGGTAFGASLHRELEYFTEAGMTPVEALASATSVPAAVFGLTDRGAIAPGLVADLVLVVGDPTADITATRSIAAVWKDGIPIPLS